MPKLHPALRAAPVALAAIALLAGCNKPKPRNEAAPAAPAPAAPAPAPAAAPQGPQTSTDSVPAVADWAKADMGKVLKDLFPKEATDCVGNTDDVNLRYTGSTPGARVEGWGWDRTAKTPVQHILLVNDANGTIVGAGESGTARPDVTKARPEVTSAATGWQAVTTATQGGLYAYGITGQGKSVCRLGHIKL